MTFKRRNALPVRPHRKRGRPDAEGEVWTKEKKAALKAELFARLAAFQQSLEYRRLVEKRSRENQQDAARPPWEDCSHATKPAGALQ